MKRKYCLGLMLLLSVIVFAQSPKREVRATWLQTVWGGDWPGEAKISKTNDPVAIYDQKSSMKKMLDKLKTANINAICFQARSRCDAMYKSSYEPWSSDLVVTRGMDPGYDPLAFVVEECHKRGIECHVWINPYRYESNADVGNWGNNDVYRKEHPDWILTVPQKKSDGTSYNATILDPGNPEVRQRIVDIIKEIITNYDIDGILFDDYFYLSGISNQDLESQKKYKPSNKSLSEWRRSNVNQLIKDIHDMIEQEKPYIRFGIGPQGKWGGDAAACQKYGVPAPSGIGGDAYGSLYCDALAWLSEGTIDYISPQLYWQTRENGNASSDYRVLSSWWSDVAHKFGRHLYVSQAAYRMVNSQELWPYDTEVKVEAELNRTVSHDDAFGGIYYNTRSYLSSRPSESKTIAAYLADNVFTHPSLLPAMSWKEYSEKTSPTNIRLEGNLLKWENNDDCRRYSVYAIPNEKVSWKGNFTTSQYFLGIAYGTSYDLAGKDDLISTCKFGVAPLDDYGNEFAPGLMGYEPNVNKPAELLTPMNGADVLNPSYFSWRSVDGAEYYVFEMSEEQKFSSVIYRRDVKNTFFADADVPAEIGKTYFWRIRTRTIGLKDCISEVRSFGIHNFEMTYPTQGATEVELSPTFTWMDAGEGFVYTLQIASDENFVSVKEFSDIKQPSFVVPLGTINSYSSYYVRVKAVRDGVKAPWSTVVKFSTKKEMPEIPGIISPVEGSFVEDSPLLIEWKENPNASQFYLQLTDNPTFAYKGRINEYIGAFVYQCEIGNDRLTPNTTYYVRLRASAAGKDTDWSPVVSFVYAGSNALDEEFTNELDLICPTMLKDDYTVIRFTLSRSQSVHLYLCDMSGKLIRDLYSDEASAGENQVMLDAASISNGFYLLVMEASDGRRTLKLMK